jgi:hypothetical protein
MGFDFMGPAGVGAVGDSRPVFLKEKRRCVSSVVWGSQPRCTDLGCKKRYDVEERWEEAT